MTALPPVSAAFSKAVVRTDSNLMESVLLTVAMAFPAYLCVCVGVCGCVHGIASVLGVSVIKFRKIFVTCKGSCTGLHKIQKHRLFQTPNQR